MRLNDWKADAEQYRDIDREMLLVARYKIGMCANGAERDGGYVRHAILKSGWTAVCGAKPGRSSAGWSHEDEPLEKVSCPRCLKKLNKRDD